MDLRGFDLILRVSSEVDRNLSRLSSKIREGFDYGVCNTNGAAAFFAAVNRDFKDCDVVFTVFGPGYLRPGLYKEIVGFAQPWIIDKSAYQILGSSAKLKTRLKLWLQGLLFDRAHKLVVELEHVKAGLIRNGIQGRSCIEVVHNCLSSLYLDEGLWESLDLEIRKERYSIGYLGRDYLHKNTDLIPHLKEVLRERHGMDVDFFVTLTESEWRSKTPFFRERVRNIGSLSVAQCPAFYREMDAIIFPSLLECFSATPLEAMAMKKPLFASDRGFVRDVCGHYAFYFDPLDPRSAADLVAEYIRTRQGSDEDRLSAARAHVLSFSNARGRAERYLEIIRTVLAEPR